MSPRQRLEAIIEQAIEMLDRMDGDCDLEHNGDLEPSLGWAKNGAIGDRFDGEILELEEPDHAA